MDDNSRLGAHVIAGVRKAYAVCLAAVIVVACSSGSALAHGHSASPSKLSFSVPATITSGTRVLVTGKVASAPLGAVVVFQWQHRKHWVSLGRASVLHGRFKLSVFLPTGQSGLRVRTILLTGRRQLAASSVRDLTVRLPGHGVKAFGPTTIVPVAIPSPATPVALSPAPPPTGSGQPEYPSTPNPTEHGEEAPKGTVTGTTGAVTLMVGSSGSVAAPTPLTSITSVASVEAAPDGVAIRAGLGVLAVEATSSAAVVSGSAIVSGTGCTAAECGVPFILTVPVTVTALTTPVGPIESFTEPSGDRVAAADGGALQEELLITVGTPGAPGSLGQALDAARAVGAVITGGLKEYGIYELRWATPQDLGERLSALEAQDGVTSVSEVPTQLNEGASLPPVASRFAEPQWLWPFEQVKAEGAWALSTGHNVRVGILDEGLVEKEHEDLNVVGYLPPPSIYYPADHSTHVAGLACARGEGIGTVGLAWGCPIVSFGAYRVVNVNGKTEIGATVQSILEGMRDLLTEGDVKVINISLGEQAGCTNAAQNVIFAKNALANGAKYRQIMDSTSGQSVIWTIAAGNNCSPLVTGTGGTNSDLPNVITVAATNSDEELASFSNYGKYVSVAAPGGVATPPELPLTEGLMSTLPAGCPSGYCSTYGEEEGTSEAAPVVAGIAADVWELHPTDKADEIGKCIKFTAGADGRYTKGQDAYPLWYEHAPTHPLEPQVPFTGEEPPIVDAEAAVECGAYVPRNVTPPTIVVGGTSPYVGETLVATDGRWTGQPTSYAYTWEDCPASGACSVIAGANESTYKITAGDLEYGIRVTVKASNHAGPSAPATSLPTSPVAATSPMGFDACLGSNRRSGRPARPLRNTGMYRAAWNREGVCRIC
jgi:hypothetical protein